MAIGERKSSGSGTVSSVTDQTILNLAKASRVHSDRGRALGVSAGNENALALIDILNNAGLSPSQVQSILDRLATNSEIDALMPLIRDFFNHYTAGGAAVVHQNSAWSKIADTMAADDPADLSGSYTKAPVILFDISGRRRVIELGDGDQHFMACEFDNTAETLITAGIHFDMLKTVATSGGKHKLQINDRTPETANADERTVRNILYQHHSGAPSGQVIQELRGFPANTTEQSRHLEVAMSFSHHVGGDPWFTPTALRMPMPAMNVNQTSRSITLQSNQAWPHDVDVVVTYVVQPGSGGAEPSVTINATSAESGFSFNVDEITQVSTYTASATVAAADHWRDVVDVDGSVWETVAGNNEYVVALFVDHETANENIHIAVRNTADGQSAVPLNDHSVHWSQNGFSLTALLFVADAALVAGVTTQHLTTADLETMLTRQYRTKWAFGVERSLPGTGRSFDGDIDFDGTVELDGNELAPLGGLTFGSELSATVDQITASVYVDTTLAIAGLGTWAMVNFGAINAQGSYSQGEWHIFKVGDVPEITETTPGTLDSAIPTNGKIFPDSINEGNDVYLAKSGGNLYFASKDVLDDARDLRIIPLQNLVASGSVFNEVADRAAALAMPNNDNIFHWWEE